MAKDTSSMRLVKSRTLFGLRYETIANCSCVQIEDLCTNGTFVNEVNFGRYKNRPLSKWMKLSLGIGKFASNCSKEHHVRYLINKVKAFCHKVSFLPITSFFLPKLSVIITI